MKRTISFVMAVVMLAACFAFAGCTKSAGSNVIKIGMQGPYTGETAVYGLAVKTVPNCTSIRSMQTAASTASRSRLSAMITRAMTRRPSMRSTVLSTAASPRSSATF